jgi:septum formation protein
MVHKVQQGQLILASKSPRRRYLLEQAGLTFKVVPSHFDEDQVALTTPAEYVRILSAEKAGEIGVLHPESWVIGADTIVVMDGAILGKPADTDAARGMLRRLSGSTHEVFTGYTISCASRHSTITDAVSTRVTFKNLSDDEIEWYIHTDEPFDKAGAYAIQGLGTFLVKEINGSYTNVVGLPVCEVIEHFFEMGVIRMRRA